MEQRRFLLFLTLSMVILIGWMNVGPLLFPSWFPKPVKPPAKGMDQPADRTETVRAKEGKPAGTDQATASDRPSKSAGGQPADKVSDKTTAEAQNASTEASEKQQAQQKLTLPDHPVKSITLGSENPDSGYFLRVRLTSVGASIVDVELNDERYTTLDKPKGAAKRPQLKVVSNHLQTADHIAPLQPQLPPLTLQAAVPVVDVQLQAVDPRASVNSISWNVAEIERDPDDPTINRSVTFRLVSPDGRFELRKKFWLTKVPLKAGLERTIRDTTPEGYQVHFDLAVRNLGREPASVRYILLGPIGLPLEDADNTHKFRDIKVGFREDDGSIDYEIVRVKEVVGKDDDEIEELKPAPRAFHFIGVDVQ
ncbi:MAG TPA: hypothetical protein EYP14_03880, partial [Planctomycetaceae bacterium]|nr:hypothetical protein [Planctomycetaceae bacterium]